MVTSEAAADATHTLAPVRPRAVVVAPSFDRTVFAAITRITGAFEPIRCTANATARAIIRAGLLATVVLRPWAHTAAHSPPTIADPMARALVWALHFRTLATKVAAVAIERAVYAQAKLRALQTGIFATVGSCVFFLAQTHTGFGVAQAMSGATLFAYAVIAQGPGPVGLANTSPVHAASMQTRLFTGSLRTVIASIVVHATAD